MRARQSPVFLKVLKSLWPQLFKQQAPQTEFWFLVLFTQSVVYCRMVFQLRMQNRLQNNSFAFECQECPIFLFFSSEVPKKAE